MDSGLTQQSGSPEVAQARRSATRQQTMQTIQGIAQLFHPEVADDGTTSFSGPMHIIVAHVYVSPWDCSPYLLRCVCRSFRGFYALRSGWTRLLGDYFSVDVQLEMTMEQACHLCNRALQEPWQGLINGQVLDEFRDSDGSILNLRRRSVASLLVASGSSGPS